MKYNKPIDKMPRKVQEIYQALIEGKDKKEIANKFKVTINEVVTIASRYQTGIRRDQLLAQAQEKAAQTQEAVEETANEKENTDKLLDDDTILEIIECIETGMSIADISEKFGYPESTIQMLYADYGYAKTEIAISPSETESESNGCIEQDEANVRPVESELLIDSEIIDQNKELFHTYIQPLQCGLIKDRHSMPCNKFVYHEIDESFMFDYKRQEEVAMDFIISNVKFDEDGKPMQFIMLYVTGLTCCLASMIKACSNLGVDLILMHFNNNTESYRSQVIFNKAGITSLPVYFKLCRMYRKVYTYGASIEEIVSNKRFYDLTISYIVSDSDTRKQDIILCKDLDDLFQVYQRMFKQFNAGDVFVELYAHECRDSYFNLKNNFTIIQSKSVGGKVERA